MGNMPRLSYYLLAKGLRSLERKDCREELEKNVGGGEEREGESGESARRVDHRTTGNKSHSDRPRSGQGCVKHSV